MTKKILSAADPAPYVVENEKSRRPVVVVCDHAGNRVPAALDNLGLSARDLSKHIAWDPGTEEIGRRIAQKLDAVYIHSVYSRLVVDLNRGADSPECMREIYDHIAVPGNRGLTSAQKKRRIAEFYTPYHRALEKIVTARVRAGARPLVISIHSFTPEMDGEKRPWEIGLLWNKNGRIAQRLARAIEKNHPRLTVGRNQPYSLKSKNVKVNTIATHVESRGLPSLTLEFRQDLVSTKKGARRWADLLLDALLPLMDDLV